MWIKILLSIPALLAGPALVLFVFLLGYDWHVAGAAGTAIVTSFSAVAAVWKGNPHSGKGATNRRSTKFMMAGIAGAALMAGAAFIYAQSFERPSKHTDLMRTAGMHLVSNGANCTPDPDAASRLDRPFIAPDKRQMETFLVQLNDSIEELPADNREETNEAIGFLTFALAMYVSEQSPTDYEKMSETDLMAKSLSRLYRFAKERGSCMTLRQYIELAEEFKEQKPAWWSQYQSANSSNPG